MFVGDIPKLTHYMLVKEVWNLGHIVMFFALTRVFGDILLARGFGLRSVCVLVLGLVALGLAVEFIQLHIGREFSLFDWAFDICGCLLALLTYPWRFSSQIRVALGVVIISLCLLPLTRQVLFEWQLYRQLPYLLRADSSIALQQLDADGQLRQSHSVSPSAEDSAIGAYLRVEYLPRHYSSFQVKRLEPDWTGWHSVNFDIVNPGPSAVNVVCRIHDIQHERGNWAMSDRFNRRVKLEPGMNHVQFDLSEVQQAPKGRLMDLSQIAYLNCFSVKAKQSFMLDYIAIYLK